MKSHKGWYRLLYPEKFIRQLDETMNSMKITKDGIFIEYKSSLELKFIRYCEMNSNITKYSLEPFPIQYIKPTDGQFHRYYIDFFVEFKNGAKFLVEIKPYSQTKPPKVSSKRQMLTESLKKKMDTYLINQAKWDAARKFCFNNGMSFIVLTEKELLKSRKK